MAIALIIGLLMLGGTLAVYGPAIFAIIALAGGVAVVIDRFVRFGNERAERTKRVLLAVGVAAIGAFAFVTGFSQILDDKKTKAGWLPAVGASDRPSEPAVTHVPSLRDRAPDALDELCRTECKASFQWDPSNFERSKVIDIANPNLPGYTGLECFYREMPIKVGYEQRRRDAEIDEQCRKIGKEGCFWSVTHTFAIDHPIDCKRAVLDPDAR
ncbi:MAG TPA: hypothetical protein VFS24_19590 [Steroidobacteraceae bacterium]|nr:hypothetical protein [Steroidobacteraceae bacterium]